MELPLYIGLDVLVKRIPGVHYMSVVFSGHDRNLPEIGLYIQLRNPYSGLTGGGDLFCFFAFSNILHLGIIGASYVN